jgi:hypothetical protein
MYYVPVVNFSMDVSSNALLLLLLHARQNKIAFYKSQLDTLLDANGQHFNSGISLLPNQIQRTRL